jgi:hypothetical protein
MVGAMAAARDIAIRIANRLALIFGMIPQFPDLAIFRFGHTEGGGAGSGLSQLKRAERPGLDCAESAPSSTASATIFRGKAVLFRK